MVDRLAPTRRPDERPIGRQRWRSLLFMHWATPADVLRTLVPPRLQLDLYDGVAYVGVVPFKMECVRPCWRPAPLAFNFLETNLRTYVIADGRPGVYFFSLEACSRIAVWAARIGWGLPYFYAQMQMTSAGDEVRYETQRTGNGARHAVRYQVGNDLGASRVGTLEHFFLERYLLFVEHRGRILSGQVHHTPYPVREAHVLDVHDDLVAAAGLPAVPGLPAFAHYSPGVDVEIFRLRPLDT